MFPKKNHGSEFAPYHPHGCYHFLCLPHWMKWDIISRKNICVPEKYQLINYFIFWGKKWGYTSPRKFISFSKIAKIFHILLNLKTFHKMKWILKEVKQKVQKCVWNANSFSNLSYSMVPKVKCFLFYFLNANSSHIFPRRFLDYK